MRSFLIFLATLLCTATAWACPAQDPAQEAALDPLYAQLRVAGSELQAQPLLGQIWGIWKTAPDDRAQDLLDKGVGRLRVSDYGASKDLLSELTEYCPNYAEGWNQLAFAKYLSNDLDGALADLDRTIALRPDHFAAIAGRGLTLLRMGRTELGFNALRTALKLHPWMSERHLLPPSEKI
ncbi:MAG: hypothetical protein AAGB15_13580 [Pseudomonadota bacterium]